MKSYSMQLVRIGVVSLFSFYFSCDQKGESRSDIATDSVALRTPALEERMGQWDGDTVDSSNAVRVPLQSPETFDWESFRSRYHSSQDSGDSFLEELAVGPWLAWNEYEYRRVYRFVNDALWIQTFYRSIDSTENSDSQGTVLLDSQNPDYIQLGPLWSDMLTRGHHLTDSLK